MFNLTRLFKARGIEKPFSYLIKAGYSENTATRLSRNRVEKLNFKTVEHLCELFKCTPNDLLEWIPSKDITDVDKHPLASLKRTSTIMSLTSLLNAVPLDRLLEIEKYIHEGNKE